MLRTSEFQAIERRIGESNILEVAGYPDIGTRQFVKAVARHVPVYMLSDYDPYGIEIFLTYKYGSHAMWNDETLKTSSLRWMGLHGRDIANCNIPNYCQLKMVKEDFLRAKGMMLLPHISAEIAEEIRIMMQHGMKYELESLAHLDPMYLGSVYIPNKIAQEEYVG